MTYNVLLACVLLMWLIARRIPAWARERMKQREADRQESQARGKRR